MTKKILVCDDEPAIRSLLSYNLKKEGFIVVEAETGKEAIQRATTDAFDVILLDIMLPDVDGYTVCRSIQSIRQTPIIFLTAKDSEIDTVLGLELGADDYVTKPFSVRELIARIKTVSRRHKRLTHTTEEQRLGDLVVKFASRQVFVNNREVLLTPIEYELLSLLVQNHSKALHRQVILDVVWGTDFIGDARLIDVHVSHLRDKLQIPPQAAGYIETVRSIGYRLRG